MHNTTRHRFNPLTSPMVCRFCGLTYQAFLQQPVRDPTCPALVVNPVQPPRLCGLTYYDKCPQHPPVAAVRHIARIYHDPSPWVARQIAAIERALACDPERPGLLPYWERTGVVQGEG